MKMAALSDIAEINPPAPRPGAIALDALVDFVPMAAVSEEGAISVPEQRPYQKVLKGYTAFRRGDVLLAKITPCYENNKIAIADVKTDYAFGSTEFHVVRCENETLDPKYLAYFLRQDRVRHEGERRMTGSAGQRRVPKAFLESLKIPIPPLDEQRRIAAILDQADALRRLRQRAIDRLNDLGQAIFYEMFGDPVTNPMGWDDHRTLGEAAAIVSGITKGRRLNGKPTRTVPYLAVINVQDRELRLDPLKTIEATEDEIDRYSLKKGDLLLTEGGDPDKLGRGTLWNNEVPECIHQNHIFRVRVSCDDIEPLFLNWLVGSERGKRYFLRSAKQTTGIASINMTQLRGFPLIVPPEKLQRNFATRMAAVEMLIASQRAALGRVTALFSSIQFRVFRGGAEK